MSEQSCEHFLPLTFRNKSECQRKYIGPLFSLPIMMGCFIVKCSVEVLSDRFDKCTQMMLVIFLVQNTRNIRHDASDMIEVCRIHQ